MGLILLPTCPLCFAMWLSAVGITGVSLGRVHASLVGLLLLLMIFSGVKLLSLRLFSIFVLVAALAASYAIRLSRPVRSFRWTGSAGALIALFFVLYWSCIYGHSKAWQRFFQACLVQRRASRFR
jgi:hypothetical protein